MIGKATLICKVRGFDRVTQGNWSLHVKQHTTCYEDKLQFRLNRTIVFALTRWKDHNKQKTKQGTMLCDSVCGRYVFEFELANTTYISSFVAPTTIDGDFSHLKPLSDKFNLLAVICLPRIIGSFFRTHASRLVFPTPVEMKGDRECVLKNNAMQPWIRDSPCRTTFVPQSGPPQWQIFSFDRIYGNLVSFLEPNKNTSRKTMAKTNGTPDAITSALLCLCCMHPHHKREQC